MINSTTVALLALCQAQVQSWMIDKYSKPATREEYQMLIDISDARMEFIGYPSPRRMLSLTQYELAIATSQTINILKREPEFAKQLPAVSYSFLDYVLNRYAPVYPSFGYDLGTLRASLWDSYQAAYRPTPTPEVTNTPDHHWAKISLDILYKNQILIGDPTTPPQH